jgi:hypothetical protein
MKKIIIILLFPIFAYSQNKVTITIPTVATTTATTRTQGNNTTNIATTAYADSLTKLKFTTVTATSTTVTDLKGILIYDMDCTSNVDTLKLPAAATVSGNFFITIRKKDNSINKVVVVANNGAETINGSTSMWIQFQNTSETLYSNGTNYYAQ